MKPIRDLYPADYRLAPLSVLVDPDRANEMGNADDDVAFLFHKQIEEADLVCLTKSDLNVPLPALRSAKPVRSLSAKTGEGVEAWLDEISGGQIATNAPSIELDYARYARAEAALGWLNATIKFELNVPISPPTVVGPLMDHIDHLLTANNCAIVHLKLIDETSLGFLKAAICRNGSEPEIEGDLLSPPVLQHRVTVNLRAQADPSLLRSTLDSALHQMPRNQTVIALSSFRPAAPQPALRYV